MAGQRAVDMLVAIGAIPEETAKDAEVDDILKRIKRSFNSDSYRESVNPNVQVGGLMARWRDEIDLTQAQVARAMNDEYQRIGMRANGQSSISRLEAGVYTLSYIQVMAFLRVVREKTGKPIPADFLSPWAEDRQMAEDLLVWSRNGQN